MLRSCHVEWKAETEKIPHGYNLQAFKPLDIQDGVSVTSNKCFKLNE